MTAFIAAATAGPGRLAAEVAGGVDLGGAVGAERARRRPSPSPPTEGRDVGAPSERALVSSSSVPVVGAPSAAWAKTQMVSMAMVSFLSPSRLR